MCKISIVVPVYNSERFLRSTLDSLLAQTLFDIEIVCVNDGSSDSSLQILEEYASKEPRVVVVDSVNGGVSSARNKGVEIAKGEYIGSREARKHIAWYLKGMKGAAANRDEVNRATTLAKVIEIVNKALS